MHEFFTKMLFNITSVVVQALFDSMPL